MRIWRLLALGGALMHLGLFGYVAIDRFDYPYELEWMTGSILDHVEKLHQGLAHLYAAPSVDWIPFLYPPLHYWVGGWFTRLVPGFQGLRLLSLLCTLVIAGCVWRLSRSHGATRFWAAIATGYFFACYSLTGFWFDVERCDMLALALLCTGAVVLTESAALPGAAAAGALFALAALAKQPSLTFIAFAAGTLLLLRQARRALALAGGALAVLLPSVLMMTLRTHGWFLFYTFFMPRAHGIELRFFFNIFTEDFGRPLLMTVSTFAVLATLPKKPSVFAGLLAAGLFAAVTSRLHMGGWSNVLMFWIPFGCVALGLFATRLETLIIGQPWARRAQALMAGLVVVQFALLAFDPENQIPSGHREMWASRFVDKVRELERGGEVLVVGRGHVTAHRHYQQSALFDLLRMPGQQPPQDLVDGVRSHRFAAIILDSVESIEFRGTRFDSTEFQKLVIANYAIAEQWDDRDPPPIVGYFAHPQLILRPRTQPLPMAPLAELRQTWMGERAQAEARMRAAQVVTYKFRR